MSCITEWKDCGGRPDDCCSGLTCQGNKWWKSCKKAPPVTGASGGSSSDVPLPQDCVMNSWSSWSACSVKCGGGTQTRNRTVKTMNAYGGQACPSLNESRACNTQACPVNTEQGICTNNHNASDEASCKTKSKSDCDLETITINQFGTLQDISKCFWSAPAPTTEAPRTLAPSPITEGPRTPPPAPITEAPTRPSSNTYPAPNAGQNEDCPAHSVCLSSGYNCPSQHELKFSRFIISECGCTGDFDVVCQPTTPSPTTEAPRTPPPAPITEAPRTPPPAPITEAPRTPPPAPTTPQPPVPLTKTPDTQASCPEECTYPTCKGKDDPAAENRGESSTKFSPCKYYCRKDSSGQAWCGGESWYQNGTDCRGCANADVQAPSCSKWCADNADSPHCKDGKYILKAPNFDQPTECILDSFDDYVCTTSGGQTCNANKQYMHGNLTCVPFYSQVGMKTFSSSLCMCGYCPAGSTGHGDSVVRAGTWTPTCPGTPCQ